MRLGGTVRLSQRDLLILVVVCLAIAAVAMVFAVRPASRPAPGGQSVHDAGPGGAFVGRWKAFGPQMNAWYEVDITRSGSEFLVTIPVAIESARFLLANGKLVAASSGTGGTGVLSLEHGHVVLTAPSSTVGAPDVVETLKPIPSSAPTPTPDASACADQIMAGVHDIQIAVQTWAVKHEDAYPPPYMVVPGGDVAQYVEQWPTDPYTGKAMTPGTGPGQYQYTLQGNEFSITAYGPNGAAIFTVP